MRYKTITNFKTGAETRRHWHFGIDGRPFTHPKVLFSDQEPRPVLR